MFSPHCFESVWNYSSKIINKVKVEGWRQKKQEGTKVSKFKTQFTQKGLTCSSCIQEVKIFRLYTDLLSAKWSDRSGTGPWSQQYVWQTPPHTGWHWWCGERTAATSTQLTERGTQRDVSVLPEHYTDNKQLSRYFSALKAPVWRFYLAMKWSAFIMDPFLWAIKVKVLITRNTDDFYVIILNAWHH